MSNKETEQYVGFVPTHGQRTCIIEKGLRKLVFTKTVLKGTSSFDTSLLSGAFGAAKEVW